MAQNEENKVEINALRTFCHAIPRGDGSIDPHQPYMGIISVTVFRGQRLPNVNILANVITELRVVQPGVNYPVRVARFRNGSLKEFTNSGKRLFTIFNTQGTDLQYSDHLGVGFNEFLNQKVIEGLLARVPENEGNRAFYRVMFTVDINGKVHKLDYQRFEKELSENAHKVLEETSDSDNSASPAALTAGEELLSEEKSD